MKDRPLPTAVSDPEGYLALRKFSQRIICPRTGLPVSFSDIGDPNGTPLLWLMPSGCSRWFAASQDPLAKRYHIRLIAIDRPGVGATPMVPLKDRIRTSCDMAVSVLQHLDVKLAHILATSAGVYYALSLLIHHPDIFLTALDPPPTLYLVAPWSPLLPSTHPDYYNSPLAWIPDKLIETQHLTMPHLLTIAQSAMTVWETSTKALSTSFSFAKSYLWSSDAVAASSSDAALSGGAEESNHTKTDVHANNEGMPVLEDDGGEEEDEGRGLLWGKFSCCVGCTTTEYFHAENFEGVGQEHLQCLDRGTGTGHEWFENHIALLAKQVRQAQSAVGEKVSQTLDIQIWWGWQDAMVPRKGQLWLNKTLTAHPDAISVSIHDVPDGDHTDLLGRLEGIHQVYGMIWQKGNTTGLRTAGRSDMAVEEADEV